MPDLLALLDSSTEGDLESPLRWICKNLRVLTDELRAKGHAISHVTMARLLKLHGYSLRSNTRARAARGDQSRELNRQFEHINTQVAAALAARQAVISVSTRALKPRGQRITEAPHWPLRADATDAQTDVEPSLIIQPRACEIGAGANWVLHHEMSAAAVQTIRRWWLTMGHQGYPHATELTIIADSGGASGYRAEQWGIELGRLAEETGVRIQALHLPSATSKWNKIEHRLSSFVAVNWQDHPLIGYEVIIQLIGSTQARSWAHDRAT